MTKWMPRWLTRDSSGLGTTLESKYSHWGKALARAVPELHEPQHLAGLLGTRQVGVGIAQHAVFLLKGEERQHAGGRLTRQGMWWFSRPVSSPR